jgi:predicted CXXCH cytochrome family protein
VWLAAFAGCALFVLIFAFAAPAAAQRTPANKMPPSVSATLIPIPSGQEDQYVGADRCQSCHKSEFTEYHKSPHASLVSLPGMVSGCEVCHGPGLAHSKGEEDAEGDDALTAAANKLIFAFEGTPEENASRCLTCHSSSKSQASFAHSEHFAHGVECQNCHTTHLVVAAQIAAGDTIARTTTAQARIFEVPDAKVEATWLQDSLLREPQPTLCYSCHANIQAKFALPTHHRVPEGTMKCTDCHQPHGTDNPNKLRTEGWEACVSCHVEKRGPFVFEHASVQVEGCVACHSPHGSANRMLLERREGRFLCLQCHVDPANSLYAPGEAPSGPAAANTPHGHLGFQTSGECTRCHVAIHGSNFNAAFLQ